MYVHVCVLPGVKCYRSIKFNQHSNCTCYVRRLLSCFLFALLSIQQHLHVGRCSIACPDELVYNYDGGIYMDTAGV